MYGALCIQMCIRRGCGFGIGLVERRRLRVFRRGFVVLSIVSRLEHTHTQTRTHIAGFRDYKQKHRHEQTSISPARCVCVIRSARPNRTNIVAIE